MKNEQLIFSKRNHFMIRIKRFVFVFYTAPFIIEENSSPKDIS